MFLWSTNVLDHWWVWDPDPEQSGQEMGPCQLGRPFPTYFHERSHLQYSGASSDFHSTSPLGDSCPGAWWPPGALWNEEFSLLFDEKPLEKRLKHTLDPLLSFPCGAESQQAKSAVAQVFLPKWSLWFFWHWFVDLFPLFKSSFPGKQLRETWLGPFSSPPGIIFLFLDGVAQCLWTLTTSASPAQEALAGSPELMERSFHRSKKLLGWSGHGMRKWLYLWCLRLCV